MAAYARYAGKVPPLSMQLLAYMALVSKDADERPWYGEGHHALAAHAMGRPSPDESDLRAVRRAVTPLIEAGALTVDRRGAVRNDGPSTVRYRLNLKIGDIGRKPSGVPPLDAASEATAVDAEDPPHRTECGPDVGRFVAAHRTKSVLTQDGNRPPKEPRGTKRSEKTEDELDDLRTDVAVAREDTTAPTPDSSPTVRPTKCSHGLSAGLRPDGSPVCALCRVAARGGIRPDPEPPEPGGHGPPDDGGWPTTALDATPGPDQGHHPHLRLIRGAA